MQTGKIGGGSYLFSLPSQIWLQAGLCCRLPGWPWGKSFCLPPWEGRCDKPAFVFYSSKWIQWKASGCRLEPSPWAFHLSPVHCTVPSSLGWWSPPQHLPKRPMGEVAFECCHVAGMVYVCRSQAPGAHPSCLAVAPCRPTWAICITCWHPACWEENLIKIGIVIGRIMTHYPYFRDGLAGHHMP